MFEDPAAPVEGRVSSYQITPAKKKKKLSAGSAFVVVADAKGAKGAKGG